MKNLHEWSLTLFLYPYGVTISRSIASSIFKLRYIKTRIYNKFFDDLATVFSNVSCKKMKCLKSQFPEAIHSFLRGYLGDLKDAFITCTT